MKGAVEEVEWIVCALECYRLKGAMSLAVSKVGARDQVLSKIPYCHHSIHGSGISCAF